MRFNIMNFKIILARKQMNSKDLAEFKQLLSELPLDTLDYMQNSFVEGKPKIRKKVAL